jgi:hypothetical protein
MFVIKTFATKIINNHQFGRVKRNGNLACSALVKSLMQLFSALANLHCNLRANFHLMAFANCVGVKIAMPRWREGCCMVGKCEDDKIPGMLCICSDDIGSVRMYTNAIARAERGGCRAGSSKGA